MTVTVWDRPVTAGGGDRTTNSTHHGRTITQVCISWGGHPRDLTNR